jgi:hypothetical protein
VFRFLEREKENAVLKASYIKWGLLAIVLAVFVPWSAMVYARERSSQQAIEVSTQFITPRMQMRFPKDIRWDPQSFLGRGKDAGFWDWSPKGVVLTPKGENIFGDNGKEITGDLVVGTREISTIKSVQPRGDTREVLFLYTWTDFTDATKLFSTPPQKGKEYEALAVLSEKSGGWEVTSLTTPEYSRVLDILTAETKHP